MYQTLTTFPVQWISVNELPPDFLLPEATPSICQVLIGTTDDFDIIEENIEDIDVTTEKLLADAEKLDVVNWFNEQGKNSSTGTLTIQHTPASEYGMTEEQLAEAKKIVQLDAFEFDDTEPVPIGLCTLPVQHSWQAPCYLKFGYYNDCPAPSVHAAILKYWHERYDIRVATITASTIECIVKNPPQTEEEAIELAIEHAIYCPDIAESIGGVEELAGHLLNNVQWFFWWD